MKLRLSTVVTALLFSTTLAFGSTSSAKSDSSKPMSLADQISYTVGVEMGKNLSAQSININTKLLAQGIDDSMSGGKLLLTQAQMDSALKEFQAKLVAKQQAQLKALADKNAQQGTQFLANNKKQPGVVALPDGLQYKVLNAGKGQSPKADDTVTVNYQGAFTDGQVFSSTYDKQPVTFKVSQVIAGWQEALQKMNPGAEWMVYVPAKLAYGTQGVGNTIGPNETLVFKIKLLSVDSNNDNTDKKATSSAS